jgi:glycosyltransferase involved in cell wall biosynthesis
MRAPLPKVNIVIPCHNYEEFVAEAVESVLGQTYRDWTLTLIDDGSTDGSLDIMRRYEELPGVRIIEQPNSGVSRARNAGIAAVGSEYVLTLDADDLLDATFLEKTVPVLDADASLGLVYTWMMYFGEQELLIENSEYEFEVLLRENFVNTTSLFRRAAWAQVGGFDTEIGGYEDWEFWIALGEKGWFGKVVPEPLFRYRRHGDSLVVQHDSMGDIIVSRIKAKHAALYAKGVADE